MCYYHGGNAGAPKGKANGSYKHGRHTNDAIANRKALAALLREAHHQIEELSKQGGD